MRRARFETPDEATRTLLAGYIDASPIVRSAAARVAAVVSGPQCEAALVLLLHDHHPDVYHNAFRSLHRRGVDAEERLQRHLLSGPEATRYWGAHALAKLRLPSAATFLMAALFDRDPQVVAAATTGLTLIPQAGLIGELVDVARQTGTIQRAGVIRGLTAHLPEFEPPWVTMVRVVHADIDRHLQRVPRLLLEAGLRRIVAEHVMAPQHSESERSLALLNMLDRAERSVTAEEYSEFEPFCHTLRPPARERV